MLRYMVGLRENDYESFANILMVGTFYIMCIRILPYM
jgi:hypothetical protein